MALTFLAFSPTLDNDFVDWDDTDTLTANPFYRGLGWSQLRWMWTTTLMGHYIPLTWMTFGLDYVVWGMHPVGYHLTSLLLHVANAGLAYAVALRLLSTALGDARSAVGVRLGAAFAAALFAMHPLRVESVAWATERRDVLCGFFALLALLAYLRHAEERRGLPLGTWYWASLACFVAAVLSKAMAVTLPAILVILDVYPLRRFARGAWIWIEKLPFAFVSVAASAIVIVANRDLVSLVDLSLLERAGITVYGVAFYFWKTIVPLRLAALYELETPVPLLSWPFLLGAAFCLAVTGFAIRVRGGWPGVWTAWLASLVLLAPVSGIAQNGPQVAADRYTYLPTLPWAMLGGAALARMWRAAGSSRPAVATLRVAAPCVIVVALGALAAIQTRTWRDSERLWTHALAVTPSSLAHYNLGVVVDGQGRRDEAIEHYRRAIQLKPDYPDAHYNRGVALSRQGRGDEAIHHYREALRIKPEHAEAHYNWGLVASAQGKADEAIDHYRKALALKPQFAAAHNNWGNVLTRQGRFAEAIDHYREAARIKPDYAEAHNNWGTVLAQQGRWNEAIDRYRRALEIRADFPAARQNLDRALDRLAR